MSTFFLFKLHKTYDSENFHDEHKKLIKLNPTRVVFIFFSFKIKLFNLQIEICIIYN